jgi:hypothetical protein
VYPDSRQTIHMGINYLFNPVPVINRQSHLRFQQGLFDEGIDFKTTSLKEPVITVIREEPSRLEVKIAALGQPTGQFLVVAPQSGCDVEVFVREVEAILRAFESTWPSRRRQVVTTDATFRDLYETTAEHAFQEIWEMRLGQSAQELERLGQPVLGGGLRFVMPAQSEDSEGSQGQVKQVEVKIESFLRDTKKIFVETQFTWPQPSTPGAPFDPSGRLRQVDSYVENEVVSFLLGGSQ